MPIGSWSCITVSMGFVQRSCIRDFPEMSSSLRDVPARPAIRMYPCRRFRFVTGVSHDNTGSGGPSRRRLLRYHRLDGTYQEIFTERLISNNERK
jgi:hypothetical protein